VDATHDGESVIVRVRDRALSSGRQRALRGALSDSMMAADARDRVGDGIGLRNTRERLALLYGDAAGVTLVHAEQETVASVWVPLAVDPSQVRETASESAPTDGTATDAVATI
jgi:LytS/YehU family sensor histidine kinase